MKNAILTIATNNYKNLLIDLIETIDNNFDNYNNDIFVFSDKNIFKSSKNNIVFNEIKHENWPNVTLKRFEYFSKITNELSSYDNIIYIDCDMILTKKIDKFPDSNYFFVSHPSNMIIENFWPTEKNELSTSFLPYKKNIPYVQGCLWGGKSDNIIKLITTLNENIKEDLENDIVACWHDESHLNKYVSTQENKDILILDSGWAYPETWKLNVEKIFVHRDKNMNQYPRFEGI